MNKPINPKCDTCFVIDNTLRCFNCKYKTEAWVCKNLRPIMMLSEKDLYKPKVESE